MRRPWQVWLLFGLSLSMVTPAMIWLTFRALELDRAEALAQHQADLEETIGSALWQMDTELGRLVATEIARPVSFYRAFTPLADLPGMQKQQASPLLMQPSPHVLLHFEIGPDGAWTSPQCPTPGQYDLAIANDIPRQNIDQSNLRLQELSQSISYDKLLAQLPEQNLAANLVMQNPLAMNNALMPPPSQSKVVQNSLDLETVQQQLEDVQSGPQVPNQGQQAQVPMGANSPGIARNQRVQMMRGDELQNRNQAFQATAQQAIWDQRGTWNYKQPNPPEIEGISQPVWIGEQLLLARRVESDGRTLIQGCWLNWPQIRTELLTRVANWLPEAELEPLNDSQQVRFNRVLATLPVQLVVPEPAIAVAPFSPIRVSLIVAWGFLGLATVAMAILLSGVVALSERRAAFVSAVTHELRTPLTTFRMYSEMLAEGMVSDPDQQKTYLETLRVEADRLSHLVENVLQYARLERGAHGQRRDPVEIAELLNRVEPRLRDRATQADMELIVDASEATREVEIATDPAAVEQILFNLVDNACKYASSATDRRIHWELHAGRREIRLEIRDHGPGISAAESRRLFEPFSKSAYEAADSAPGVGLGLALCRRLAKQLGGKLQITESKGNGAAFSLSLPR